MTDKEKIKKLHGALAGLVGASETKELEQMEAIIRVAPVPDKDKVATINAIHALIEFNEDIRADS